eukprot:1345761-Amphidinium_carterae.1
MLLAATSESSNAEVDEMVWQQCLDETTKGWLEGPYTVAELSQKLGQTFAMSRRFGLRQHEKVRLIDDLAES